MLNRTRKMISIVYYNRRWAARVVSFVAIISLLLVFAGNAALVEDSASEAGNDVLSSQTIQDWVQPLLFQVDSNLAIAKSYATKGLTFCWFPDITFVQIDTFPVSPLPRDPRNVILMVAFSADGQAFRLRGFESNDFNQLVEESEVTVDSASVLDYGRDYLRLTTIFDPHLVVFLTSRADFLEFNENLAKQDSYGAVDNEVWVAESTSICETLPDGTLEKASSSAATDNFQTVHHAWLMSTGEIKKYILEIRTDGRCKLVDSIAVGHNVGYSAGYRIEHPK